MNHPFFSRNHVSLKICGVTRPADAYGLVEHGVEAIGINFWPHSKRYCPPQTALSFAPAISGKILRVGVFVNAPESEILKCFEHNLIDIAQFHGDESPELLKKFSQHGLPFIRALGVEGDGRLPDHTNLSTSNLILDAHAPSIYGGTGKTIDWKVAKAFIDNSPSYHTMLAGGITPENAHEAAQAVKPCALDIASGAESSPGVKDFDKIKRIVDAVNL